MINTGNRVIFPYTSFSVVSYFLCVCMCVHCVCVLCLSLCVSVCPLCYLYSKSEIPTIQMFFWLMLLRGQDFLGFLFPRHSFKSFWMGKKGQTGWESWKEGPHKPSELCLPHSALLCDVPPSLQVVSPNWAAHTAADIPDLVKAQGFQEFPIVSLCCLILPCSLGTGGSTWLIEVGPREGQEGHILCFQNLPPFLSPWPTNQTSVFLESFSMGQHFLFLPGAAVWGDDLPSWVPEPHVNRSVWPLILTTIRSIGKIGEVEKTAVPGRQEENK